MSGKSPMQCIEPVVVFINGLAEVFHYKNGVDKQARLETVPSRRKEAKRRERSMVAGEIFSAYYGSDPQLTANVQRCLANNGKEHEHPSEKDVLDVIEHALDVVYEQQSQERTARRRPVSAR